MGKEMYWAKSNLINSDEWDSKGFTTLWQGVFRGTESHTHQAKKQPSQRTLGLLFPQEWFYAFFSVYKIALTNIYRLGNLISYRLNIL
jgi:hypothetical protein